MNFIKTIFFFLFLSTVSVARGHNITDSIEINFLTQYINTNYHILDQKISISPKEGYEFKLIGSDNQTIIDLNGNIYQPLIQKQVNLLYNVVRQVDSSSVEIPLKNIIIKGKYPDGGINPKPFVIPSLREWYGYEGDFLLSASTRIIIPSELNSFIQIAELLQADLEKINGIKLPIVSNKRPKKGDIIFEKSNQTHLGTEGYTIEINDVVKISAPAYSGHVFATRTILQLLEQSPHLLSLPKGNIKDYPTYEVRGLMLDVGRKFFTIDFLNDYVELLSYYKISNFQIHLNDNAFHKYFEFDWDKTPSGFRLENSTYPNLASQDGHYTKKEFVDLQKKAQLYGIKIIPEIDVPAHSLAITKAIPDIASDMYGKDHLDLNNPKTYEVVKNIFDEYTKGENPIFIGDEVHIGTDEYDKKEAEQFRTFTDYLIKVVQNNGKSVRAWGALTHAQGSTPVTSENVTLNMWYNGYADPLEMKKLGYKQISTPDGWLYIVPAAGYYYDYLNTDHIYNHWEPRKVGQVVFEKGDPTIVGGMFAVWNDIAGNGISEKDVHQRVFHSLQTLAEKMWTAGDDHLNLFEFNQKKKNINEGPGINLRGVYGNSPQLLMHFPFDNSVQDAKNYFKTTTKSNLSNFKKGILNQAIVSNHKSIIELPIEEIGQNYTVSFWIKSENNGEMYFKSKNAFVQINQDGVHFNRDQYHYTLTDTLDLRQWNFITITGNKEKTSLYVNGKLINQLDREKVILPYKDKAGKDIFYNKVSSLTFPLKKIQLEKISLDDLKIFNVELNKDEILNEYLLNTT